MAITRDRAGAFVFLAFSLGYGLAAQEIELYPGAEFDPLTARTFPEFLAMIGAGVSLLLLVMPARGDTILDRSRPRFTLANWLRVGLLLAAMWIYGVVLSGIGFVLSTALFLGAGFLILGERRWWLLVLLPLAISAGFAGLLEGLLDLYLDDPLIRWLSALVDGGR